MKTSIFRRMLWAQAAGLTLLIGLSVSLEFGSAYLGFSSGFDQTMQPFAIALARFVSEEPDQPRMETMARKIQELDEKTSWGEDLRPRDYRALYQVLDSQGHILFRTQGTPLRPYTDQGPGFRVVNLDGKRTRVLVQDSPNGRIRVIVGESLSLRRRVIFRSMRNLPLGFLLTLAPMALFTWLVARRVLRPLRHLAVSVEARPATDLSPLVPSVDLKEVRPLLAALNQQMSHVSELIESQRRFVADAAHSLRTPLAVLGAQAHALVQAPGQKEREELGAELQAGIERGTSVVRQLLSVARLEGIDPNFKLSSVDMGQLIRERVALLVPLALRQEQDLGVEGPEHLSWPVDDAMFATAVDNLLENALRYTPEGGRITVRLGEDQKRFWCEVEDNGPGIPADFRERAFDRFTRAADVTKPGAGLGLAIVRRAVELHGGTVWLLEPKLGQGLVARIELP